MSVEYFASGFYQSDIRKWSDNVAGHEVSGEGRIFLTFYDRNKFVKQLRPDKVSLKKEELLDERYETGIFEIGINQISLIISPDKEFRRTEKLDVIDEYTLLYSGIPLNFKKHD